MPQITPYAFVIGVPDLNRTSAYFRDVLGFKVIWKEATGWRLAERDGVRIMIGHTPNDVKPSELGSHNWFGYIETDDLDAIHAELISRGATCKGPFQQHYGMREIVVTTIDGHRIVFGQEVRQS